MPYSSTPAIEAASRAETAGLRVHLLGSPRVEWAGRRLVIPRRQVRALLFRLAARLETIHRDQLCFLFWPDVPDRTARRNLTHLLTHLRRGLPKPQLLWISNDQIGLNTSDVWSDVAAFEQLCAVPQPGTSSRHKQPGPSGAGTQALERAADLYQGAFLTGFSLPSSQEF